MNDLGKLTGGVYSYIGNNVAQMLVLVANSHLVNYHGSSDGLVKRLPISLCWKEVVE